MQPPLLEPGAMKRYLLTVASFRSGERSQGGVKLPTGGNGGNA